MAPVGSFSQQRWLHTNTIHLRVQLFNGKAWPFFNSHTNLLTFMALISPSSLPPSLSSSAASAALRAHHRPGILTNARPASSLKAFLPSAGDLRPELDDNPEAIISGEWTQNFSLLIYEDLLAYLRSQPPAKKAVHFGSTAPLGEVMSSAVIRMANTEQSVSDIADHFEHVSRLPVVDGELRCLGILSKKDLLRAENGVDFLNTPCRFLGNCYEPAVLARGVPTDQAVGSQISTAQIISR
ncbi:hypothetical protein KSP39_PZI000669 [Platanthera zijinensis]|uniref:CBS domain-containing protein n=1 Tax=Platanthera zijinensis TaxID=2320716 RepID=A0AAP0C1N8_9ASPA